MGACATSSKIAIVMELMESGSLYAVLHNSSYDLPWKRRMKMAMESVQGMIYLISCHLIHRGIDNFSAKFS